MKLHEPNEAGAEWVILLNPLSIPHRFSSFYNRFPTSEGIWAIISYYITNYHTNLVSFNNYDLLFLIILWVRTSVGLVGPFLCSIWCWLEVTHSAWFICGWAGLEALRQFHSVVRCPHLMSVFLTCPHLIAEFSLPHIVVVWGQPDFSHGSWLPRGKKEKLPIL